jgi:hypothetical protein
VNTIETQPGDWPTVYAQCRRYRAALDAAEAERIALADAFRATLEGQGMDARTAALLVQDIIDQARMPASSRTQPTETP